MSNIVGLDNVLNNLDRVESEMERDAKKGARKAADHILAKTIPVTPMSDLGSGTSGNLRKSGKTKVEVTGSHIDGVITFGDGRVDYAAAVHEMPETNNWSEPGTGSKYLEKTIRREQQNALSIIEREVKL